MSDRPYERHYVAVGGDAMLGLFMKHLCQFLAGAKHPACFIDHDGVEREGIARTWQQWADELGYTLKEFRRVLEKAERLGYIVRARRTWGRDRAIRLHLAITKAYIVELTRCVALDATAYRKVTRAAGQRLIVAAEGQYDVAQMGDMMLPTAGSMMLPTVGSYKEDSSLTLSGTFSDTAFAANADEPQPSLAAQTSPEKTLTPTPHSPPSPMNKAIVAAVDEVHTETVTSHGLATKLSALGWLVEWQRVCEDHGISGTESVTDEQLAGLIWWCTKDDRLSRSQQEEQIADLVGHWDYYTAAYCSTDEGQEQHWRARERPCLEFLRQIADTLRVAP